MAIPNNILVNVQTYQKAELAKMLNTFCGISLSNKKFKDFQDREANLGDTVTFDLTPRMTSIYGLIINPQSAVQRQQSLVCSQAINNAIAFTNNQLLFNVHDYMDRFGDASIMQLGGKIEEDILKSIIGSVTVNNPRNPNFGNLVDPRSGPYRFFGDGVTNISTYQQLAQACANFHDYGAANFGLEAIIPLVEEPAVVGSGLNQFALARNNRDAETWEIGDFSGFRWCKSNLLPQHTAGTVGQEGTILTLVSTNDPTGNNITQLTFSGATANDVNAIKQGDYFQFLDGAPSLTTKLRYLTFSAQHQSAQPVQNRVVNDAVADGSGNVTFEVCFPLVSAPNQNQNLSTSLQPGMQIKVMNSYRAGVIMSGNPLYMAMPKMTDQEPFPTVSTTDPDSGASIRHYWGAVFGQDQKSYVWDQIWGSTFVSENGLALLFPL